MPPDEASPGLDHLSLSVRAGEIVALVGVEGNGQSELVQVICGIRKATSGRVMFEGRDMTHATRRAGARSGIAVIPEDRQVEGLILPMTLTENVGISNLRDSRYSTGGVWLHVHRLRAFARRMIERFGSPNAFRTDRREDAIGWKPAEGGSCPRAVLEPPACWWRPSRPAGWT